MRSWLKSLTNPLRRSPSPEQQKILELLLDSQTWSLGRLREMQWEKLQRLLKHAYDNSPYYRAQFDRLGLCPKRDFNHLEDLKKLPILRKADLRNHLEELKTNCTDVRGNRLNSTGGSTGVPVNFYQDDNYRIWADAMRIRTWRMHAGVPKWAIEAVLWGAIRDIGSGLKPSRILKDLVRERAIQLNTFDLDKALIKKYFRYYNWIRPEILRGYASSLFFVAEFVEQHNLSIASPKIVISSAEVLKPRMRKTIESVFQAPVIDSYGCRELSHIGEECEVHQGLHIAMENQLLELEDGNLIITNLNNLGMPFLRYQVGDMAGSLIESRCECGRAAVRLDRIEGRDNENIQLPNGKTINGEFFEFLFFGLKTVEQFQVIYSRSEQQLLVRLKVRDFSENADELVKAKMKQAFDFESVTVEFSEEFEKTKTGKFRFVYVVDSFVERIK